MKEITTVPDAYLSLWQSAVAETVGRSGDCPDATKRSADTQHPLTAAAAVYAHAKDPSTTGEPTEAAPMAHEPAAVGELDLVELTALHYRKAEAEIAHDRVESALAEKMIRRTGEDDSKFSELLDAAGGVFKSLVGLLKKPVYRNWKIEGNGERDYSVVRWRLPSTSRVAIIADWGTGQEDAINVLRAACTFDPDAIIHLGDIYFAGTESECREKFLEPVREICRNSKGEPIPVFTLAGNHDYYSGGHGIHWMIDQLNDGDRRQSATYFALRSADDGWQFLAMDTGFDSRSDVGRAHKMGAVPQVDEIEWLHHKIDSFPGRTILLSHHQAISNFDLMGGDPEDKGRPDDRINSRLIAAVKDRFSRIALWLWGHEHRLMIFARDQPALGPEWNVRARCVGHGARPVRRWSFEPEHGPTFRYENIGLGLSEDGEHLLHGFELIDIAGSGTRARVGYFQVLDDGTPELIHFEEIE